MHERNNEKMISIIIPVYNAQQYLPAMLDSILCQSFRDYELLLINDGSTDSSSRICHEYAENYDCIRVFDRENRGVSASRNFGITQATGAFVWMMDSDDILADNALLAAVEAQRRSDVVIGGMEFSFASGCRDEKKVIDEELVFSGGELAQHYCGLFSQNYVSSIWNKLIRRSLITDRELGLCEGLAMYEDYLFSMDVLREAGRIHCLPTVFYRYMLREAGSLSRAHKQHISQMFRILHERIQEYREMLGRQSQPVWNSLSNLMIYLAYECVKNEQKAPEQSWRKVRDLLKDPDFSAAMREFRGYGMRYRTVHLLMKYRLGWVLRLYLSLSA